MHLDCHAMQKRVIKHIPADTWRLYNVAQRQCNAMTMRQRCINVMCPLDVASEGPDQTMLMSLIKVFTVR